MKIKIFTEEKIPYIDEFVLYSIAREFQKMIFPEEDNIEIESYESKKLSSIIEIEELQGFVNSDVRSSPGDFILIIKNGLLFWADIEISSEVFVLDSVDSSFTVCTMFSIIFRKYLAGQSLQYKKERLIKYFAKLFACGILMHLNVSPHQKCFYSCYENDNEFCSKCKEKLSKISILY